MPMRPFGMGWAATSRSEASRPGHPSGDSSSKPVSPTSFSTPAKLPIVSL